MIAKTNAERIAEMRVRRAELGLTRLEVYAHPDDHETIRFIADALRLNRQAAVKQSGYAVHHINGDQNDNRPENLQIVKVKANRKAKEQPK